LLLLLLLLLIVLGCTRYTFETRICAIRQPWGHCDVRFKLQWFIVTSDEPLSGLTRNEKAIYSTRKISKLDNRTKRWSREIEKFYSSYVQKLTQWKWYRNVGMILRTHTEENLFLPVSLYNNFKINVSCQEDGWGCNTLRPKTNIYDMKKLMNFFLKSAQNISLWIRTFMKRTVWNFIN